MDATLPVFCSMVSNLDLGGSRGGTLPMGSIQLNNVRTKKKLSWCPKTCSVTLITRLLFDSAAELWFGTLNEMKWWNWSFIFFKNTIEMSWIFYQFSAIWNFATLQVNEIGRFVCAFVQIVHIVPFTVKYLTVGAQICLKFLWVIEPLCCSGAALKPRRSQTAFKSSNSTTAETQTEKLIHLKLLNILRCWEPALTLF